MYKEYMIYKFEVVVPFNQKHASLPSSKIVFTYQTSTRSCFPFTIELTVWLVVHVQIHKH